MQKIILDTTKKISDLINKRFEKFEINPVDRTTEAQIRSEVKILFEAGQKSREKEIVEISKKGDKTL